MSTAVQRRRGTNTEHDSFTGLEGEISVNTTNESLHVHDGSTAGGFEMARADMDNVANIDDTIIGATTPADGTFTALTATTIDGVIGSVTPAAGTFTSVAIGSSPATAGAIRLENNQPINARNAADSANVNLLYLNASDDAVIGVDLTVPNNDCIVGGTSAGAASAATLYADGSIWALSNTSQKLTVGNDDYVSNTTGTTLDISVGATTGNTYTELRSLQNGRSSWGDLVLQRGGGSVVVGNTTAGATSAATLYATGAGKFSTGSSGATASPAADEFVVESSATGGISILTPDASTGYLIFGSPSDSGGPRLSYSYNSAEFVVGTGTAGHSTILKGDDRVTNLTLSGASGSELLTAAGSVSVADFLNLPSSTELTISGGVVTATQSTHYIDTEGDAATDDLDTINGGSEGSILILSSISGSRDTTLKDGTGNLALAGGDFTLTSNSDMILLRKISSSWYEISRSNNA